jgi:hypothetical protein
MIGHSRPAGTVAPVSAAPVSATTRPPSACGRDHAHEGRLGGWAESSAELDEGADVAELDDAASAALLLEYFSAGARKPPAN